MTSGSDLILRERSTGGFADLTGTVRAQTCLCPAGNVSPFLVSRCEWMGWEDAGDFAGLSTRLARRRQTRSRESRCEPTPESREAADRRLRSILRCQQRWG
jgi:hypothetical protein